MYIVLITYSFKNIADIDRLVLHNLHEQFSPFQFFIFLLKIFKEFASLYSGGRFNQREGAL